MNRQAKVFLKNELCGHLSESDEGYQFLYDKKYLQKNDPQAASCTLPLTEKPYSSKVLFPFFDGLIPEGWLLDLAEINWKLNHNDRMALLLTCCKDTIGAVSIESNEKF